MQFESSAVIYRPIDEVFAALSDIERYPRWVGELIAARKTSPGPVALGTTWWGQASFLGRELESNHQVTAFEPGRRFAYRTLDSPIPGSVSYSLTPVDGGTRITVHAELTPGALLGLAGPLLRRSGNRLYRRNLAALEALLESPGS